MRLARIQGMITRRPTGQRMAIALFRMGPIGGARAFLRGCLPSVPSAAEIATRTPPVLHVSLSWRGIARLVEGHAGLDPADGRRQLEPFFCEPVPTSAGRLGFAGRSAPSEWWNGAWSSADIDLAVHGSFAGEEQAATEIERLLASARACGLEQLRVDGFPGGVLTGYIPAGGVLHFGFRDGISEPDIDWTGDGRGTVDFREVLLGYPSSDYPTAPFADGPWKELVRDGSVACIAWIEQHVGTFEAFLDEASPKVRGLAPAGNEREWLASRVIGRWRDGSPVDQWPDAPPSPPRPTDDFDFAGDPDGRRCPLTAHIRVANLRRDEMTFANRIRFPKGPPRFVRRGFSYGKPYAGSDDGEARGLVGTFLCARVNEQFHTVLRWMSVTDFADRFDRAPYAPSMQDAAFGIRDVAGARTELVVGDAHGNTRSVALRDFITYRGVAHAMMLPIPSLQLLASDPA